MGTEDEKEKVKAVRRSQKYLVNVYVVEDPTNPDNNGKVKMLRYGKQLHKIITEAIDGEDSEEFGQKIFDLGPEGVNFKIKCENQGEYPTYVSSRFTASGKLKLSDEEQQKIYDSVFDLTKVFSLKSFDELTQMFDEHYYCRATSSKPVAPTKPAAKRAEEDEPIESFDSASIDDQIEDLLKDL